MTNWMKGVKQGTPGAAPRGPRVAPKVVRPRSAILLFAAFVVAVGSAAPGIGGDEVPPGDAARGAQTFDHSCAVCHSPIAGLNKEGPSLAGVYGRRAGAIPFFAHYHALRGLDVVWDEQSLDGWLADPRAFAGRDTAMSVKLTDAQARADVIAYLKTLK